MRIRPLIALSAVAVAGVLLAGCASGDTGSPSKSPSAATADLCSAAAPTGAASDATKVEGKAGAEPTATFTSPLEITSIQRTVATEGTGDKIADGDLVQYGIVAYDADTGDKLGAAGYSAGSVLPLQVTAAGAGQFFGCATIGSRIVLAVPATEDSGAQINVIDILGITPSAAWGAAQKPVDGFPKVELAADGTPTVTVPADLATPKKTEIEVLKKGDGETVASGDAVTVQYTGLLTDGTVFDSSWQKGAPASFTTTGVVAGFAKALEGQKAGSQVVAVIPAAEGYGDKAQRSIPANSTLVFVVDILAVQHASTQ